MVKGKTSSGFEFVASKRIRNDWRFVKALAQSDSKDESEQLQGMTTLVKLLFKDQEEALYKHLEEDDGVVPTDKVMEALREVIEALGEKNSSSSPE